MSWYIGYIQYLNSSPILKTVLMIHSQSLVVRCVIDYERISPTKSSFLVKVVKQSKLEAIL